jgi:integrase
VKPPSTIDEPIRRISADEELYLFAELQRAQDPVVPMAARFALETGCRRGEQLRLSWDNHDRAGGTVWLPDAKNGHGRYVLLTQEAEAALEAFVKTVADEKIFDVTGNQLRKAFEMRAVARPSARLLKGGSI